MRPRRHLTLIDLMAAVLAAALGLAWVVSTARGRAGPAMIVIGPLIGILYHRWRGGRGMLDGALGADGTMTYIPSSVDQNGKPVTPHQQRMDRWHEEMAQRYWRAARRPWLGVALDPPPHE
jgi:hypothetical protein